MLQPLFTGIILGATLSFLIGPAFFTLIDTSIKRGFFYGWAFAVGILISDIMYISIIMLGVSSLLENVMFKNIMSVAGGLLLIAFSIYYFTRKKETNFTRRKKLLTQKVPLVNLILKGFVLNTFNPTVLFFWIGIISSVSIQVQGAKNGVYIFLSGLFITMHGMDIIKAYVAQKINKFLTPNIMYLFNILVGVILFCFGGYLILNYLNSVLHLF